MKQLRLHMPDNSSFSYLSSGHVKCLPYRTVLCFPCQRRKAFKLTFSTWIPRRFKWTQHISKLQAVVVKCRINFSRIASVWRNKQTICQTVSHSVTWLNIFQKVYWVSERNLEANNDVALAVSKSFSLSFIANGAAAAAAAFLFTQRSLSFDNFITTMTMVVLMIMMMLLDF